MCSVHLLSAIMVSCVSLVVVVITQPLPRDGGMAKDLGALEAGKLLRASTRGRKECVAGQYRMR